MKTRLVVFALLPLLAVVLLARTGQAQVRSEYSTGAPGLLQVLGRLTTTGSVLHVAAHPDDEDSFLIARLARKDHARVAYLALNRGEGGQNVIGPEQFEALGVIRTEELLQARRLDGGEQLFTRTSDYGFSKKRSEAAAKWGEDLVLCDVIRGIRLFRPLVVIARFTGTPADGHGQHQIAGSLTPIAFEKAADPAVCPEHASSGLRPWQAKKLYVSESFQPNPDNAPSLTLSTGDYAPEYGKSYFEIAAFGRSQHKSQEMGMLELKGPQTSGVRLLKSLVATPAAEQHLFDGLDLSWPGLGRLVGLPDGLLSRPLGEMDQQARVALAELDADQPVKILPRLVSGLAAVRAARAELKAAPAVSAEARAEADERLARAEDEWQQAVASAAGIVVDALSNDELVAPGESAEVSVRAYFPDASLVKAGAARVLAPGWSVEPAVAAEASGRRRRFESDSPSAESLFRLTAAKDAAPSVPYWLEKPKRGDLYDWPSDSRQSQPFGPPLATAVVSFEVSGASIQVTVPVQHRFADPARGELRRELQVAPALSVLLDSNLHVVPASSRATTRRVAVRLVKYQKASLEGVVRLELPPGFKATPAEAPFKLNAENERTALAFDVTLPAGARPGSSTVTAVARVAGAEFRQGLKAIEYPHIQTHRLLLPAQARFSVLDVKVAPVKVGYVMGSGDLVPEAIRRLGLDVTLLDEDALSAGDLSKFDVIVVGIRASQVREDMVSNNGRLLAFARNGGTLIVQYQRPDYVERQLTPFAAKMAARVTEEDAAITVLDPKHPAFTRPNPITGEDWKGWVQERSLYELTELAPEYQPLLEASDTGEKPGRGGYVYAKLGQGHYVYTAYAFFRQLPAGVPGAYRLFANLLSLGQAPSAR